MSPGGIAPQVEAAGGVIERDGRIAIVHRPRYGDWSLPKGKLELGETFEQAALREVLEETGLVCVLGPELEPVRYVDGRGRTKLVRYWRMTVEAGNFVANEEVDELRWLSPADAVKVLTYEHDRALVDGLAPAPRR
jgi:8-oxo-dGTP diphosphatase